VIAVGIDPREDGSEHARWRAGGNGDDARVGVVAAGGREIDKDGTVATHAEIQERRGRQWLAGGQRHLNQALAEEMIGGIEGGPDRLQGNRGGGRRAVGDGVSLVGQGAKSRARADGIHRNHAIVIMAVGRRGVGIGQTLEEPADRSGRVGHGVVGNGRSRTIEIIAAGLDAR